LSLLIKLGELEKGIVTIISRLKFSKQNLNRNLSDMKLNLRNSVIHTRGRIHHITIFILHPIVVNG